MIRNVEQVTTLERPSLTVKLGGAGLRLFFLSGFLSVSGMNLAAFMMLLALMLEPRARLEIFLSNRFFWLLGFFAFYITLQTLFITHSADSFVDLHWERYWELLRLSFIYPLLIAYWLRGRSREIKLGLVLAALGLLIRLVMDIDWIALSENFAFDRLQIGRSPNMVAMEIALVLFGLAWFATTRHSLMGRLSVKIGLIALSLALFQLLVFSQSRGVWLALCVAMVPLLPVVFRLLCVKEGPGDFGGKKFLAVLSLILILFALNYETLWNRIALEMPEGSFASGQFKQELMASDSAGARLLMWNEAWKAFLDRPFFGQGLGSAPEILQQSGVEAIVDYPHFHNLYLQLAVGIGGVGMLMLLLILFALIRQAAGHLRREKGSLLLLWSGLMLIFVIANCFEYRIRNPGGQFVAAFLIAIPWSLGLFYKTKRLPVPGQKSS